MTVLLKHLCVWGKNLSFAEVMLEEECALFYCYTVLTDGIFNFSVIQKAAAFSVNGDSIKVIFISEDPSG